MLAPLIPRCRVPEQRLGMGRQSTTAQDLVEEAKKRVALLIVFAFGLAYLMSLTSSSVWINLPFAISLVIFIRYMLLEVDVRKKTVAHSIILEVDQSVKTKNVEPENVSLEKPKMLDWRKKVSSPPVEAAIEQLTRRLVSEWVTDLWYSRLTPDMDGPEELVALINNAIGEISVRARDIDLINLVTRDIVDLLCNNLELFYLCEAKIGKKMFKLKPNECDVELILSLSNQGKLHPALFSANAEHKVLQTIVDKLLSIILKPEDLKCSFFHYIARELLAHAVIKPLLSLANPRFINERIEQLVLSHANKSGVKSGADNQAVIKQKERPLPSTNHLSSDADHTIPGLELAQIRQFERRGPLGGKNPVASSARNIHNLENDYDDPLMVSRRSNSSVGKLNVSNPNLNVVLESDDSSHCQDSNFQYARSKSTGLEFAQTLNAMLKSNTQAFSPEYLENMWSKGREYTHESASYLVKQPVGNVTQSLVLSKETALSHIQGQTGGEGSSTDMSSTDEKVEHSDNQEFGPGSDGSYVSDEDDSNVTGLGSPLVRVWESKSKRNDPTSNIHHPLESSLKKKKSRPNKPKLSRTSSARKRQRSGIHKTPIWEEGEGRSLLVGDHQDILNTLTSDVRTKDLGVDSDVDLFSRVHSGRDASSLSSFSSHGSSNSRNLSTVTILADSFLKLKCAVVGANIVKSGSGMFAVYSVSVTDENNNNWSIKRRFRHFEELHRRLKEYPEYNLSLPPKYFLSSGLEDSVIRERCTLLDKYLKKLLRMPVLSGSIELWDFLSVDSQTYIFYDSLSIIQTLSVNLDGRQDDKHENVWSSNESSMHVNLYSTAPKVSSSKDVTQMGGSHGGAVVARSQKGDVVHKMATSAGRCHADLRPDKPGNKNENNQQNGNSYLTKPDKPTKVIHGELETMQEISELVEDDEFYKSPNGLVPPNLSISIFQLVDVVFQLQDGGWIRRQAFWIAKQLLQLGMGDTFDDWLVEKIQTFRKGSVIASLIQRVEQILWPDGIFLTKHPNRMPSAPVSSSNRINSTGKSLLTTEQEQEAARRAKFVYELLIEKAPAALVSLVGRREYERCAEDIYFFLQSPICLRQLAYQLLELLILTVFPEMGMTIQQLHRDRDLFKALALPNWRFTSSARAYTSREYLVHTLDG